MRTTTIEVDGLRLVADEWGDPSRPPVLLLHGGGQNRHAWRSTGQALAAAGWHAMAIDARGHGDSDWSAEARYDMDHLADDVEVLLERFERPPVAVGASMGGMSALLAQGRHERQLYRALVLVDITPRMELAGVKRILAFMSGNPEGFATLDDAADAIAAYNPHRPRSTSTAGLHRVLRQGADGRWRWLWDPAFLTSKADLLDGDGAAFEERHAVMAETLYAAARRVTEPLLLVRGGLSDLVSEEAAREFLDHVPHADFVDVSGAGHMVAGDQNDVFAASVLEFLAAKVGNPEQG